MPTATDDANEDAGDDNGIDANDADDASATPTRDPDGYAHGYADNDVVRRADNR